MTVQQQFMTEISYSKCILLKYRFLLKTKLGYGALNVWGSCYIAAQDCVNRAENSLFLFAINFKVK